MAEEEGRILESLHPLERKALQHLEDGMLLEKLMQQSGLKEIEALRAIDWLANRKAVEKISKERIAVGLDENGRIYADKGLPERRFLRAIEKKELNFEAIQENAGLSKDEFNVCIGVLKKKAAIIVDKGMIKITDQGRKVLEKKSLEELFLEKISKESAGIGSLAPEERFAYDNLKSRKGIIKDEVIKIISIKVTPSGARLKEKASKDKGADYAERLTPEMLKSSLWRNKRFRKYDIRINVPKIYGGRRHFVNQSIEHIRNVWLDMGFVEMKGPLLNTSFWNFDSLFTAQDHPVRELQDTFYIKNPEKGRLPDKKLVEAVRSMHEHGGKIGSTGWGYEWDPEEAKRNVLRTHTTVLSAKTIAQLKESDLPAKFFSVGRCFRNEALDWKHLFELTQVEGIVIDPDANFRNLIGYLKKFFKKLGYEDARVRPAYFPYTEPSAEVDVFHPIKKQWVELGGSGIFRPEVVVPLLGKDVPVLAWGLGLERSVSEYFNITDIREVYKNDLKQLRNVKMWGE